MLTKVMVSHGIFTLNILIARLTEISIIKRCTWNVLLTRSVAGSVPLNVNSQCYHLIRIFLQTRCYHRKQYTLEKTIPVNIWVNSTGTLRFGRKDIVVMIMLIRTIISSLKCCSSRFEQV
uniref:Uncharacterized protein n=1 Tax=Cacopsylla melanoneura TaxID=428564 RepID=A0A8D8W4G0_9HEMI